MLFMLNLLLVALGLAALTELAGLSLALGAFLAGMLIAETEYRYQVEEDIKPFRDVLLGLFFVTVGMALDLKIVGHNLPWVLLLLIVPVVAKLLLIVLLSRVFGAAQWFLSRASWRVCAGAPRRCGRPAACARCVCAAGACGDGALHADRATAHSLRRTDCAEAHGQRLACARSADHADRRDGDGT